MYVCMYVCMYECRIHTYIHTKDIKIRTYINAYIRKIPRCDMQCIWNMEGIWNTEYGMHMKYEMYMEYGIRNVNGIYSSSYERRSMKFPPCGRLSRRIRTSTFSHLCILNFSHLCTSTVSQLCTGTVRTCTGFEARLGSRTKGTRDRQENKLPRKTEGRLKLKGCTHLGS